MTNFKDDPKIKPRDDIHDSKGSVIEVEFVQDVHPNTFSMPSENNKKFKLTSISPNKLNKFNAVLEKYDIQKLEPSFAPSANEALEPNTLKNTSSELPNPQDLVRLYFPRNSNIKQIAKELKELPEIKRAVPVFKAIPPTLILADPLLGSSDKVELDPINSLENQWYIFRCGADKAWGNSAGDNVIVADIDWGYIVTHEDLSNNLDIQNAYNSFDGGTNVSFGESSHGTAVMGIVGAPSNGVGLKGFSPNSSLWPIQADSGPGTELGGDSWARAIEWVRTRNSNGKRKVIILEVQTGAFGNYEQVPSVNLAIKRAISSGVVVCVAAGNGDRDASVDDLEDPIPETGSILVGATQYDPSQNKRAWFSNFGSRITVSAPGDSDHDVTCSSLSNDAYRNEFGGTSGATPKVAGTVALMLSVNPNLTHEEIRQMLISTGTNVITEQSKPVGKFLNTHAAVEAAKASMTQ